MHATREWKRTGFPSTALASTEHGDTTECSLGGCATSAFEMSLELRGVLSIVNA